MINEYSLDWSKAISIQNGLLMELNLETPLKDILYKLTDSLDELDDNHAVTVLLNSAEGLRPTAGGRISQSMGKTY